jgi:hypothetical protein
MMKKQKKEYNTIHDEEHEMEWKLYQKETTQMMDHTNEKLISHCLMH